MSAKDQRWQKEIRKALGERIRALRQKNKKWSSEQAFASACRMSVDTLAQIERGITIPIFRRLQRSPDA